MKIPIRFGLLLCVLLFSTSAAVRSWEAEYRRARDVNVHEGPIAALRVVEDALARAGNSDDEWVIALRIYRYELLGQSANLPEAEQALEKPLPARLRKSEVEFRRRIALTMVFFFRSKPKEAQAITKDIVAFTLKHVPHLAAEAYYVRGNVFASEADIREAIRLARKRGDEVVALHSEGSLVYVLQQAGRPAEAVEAGERVLPRLQKAGLRQHTTVTGNIGTAYFALGDHETAKEYLLAAEPHSRRMGISSDLSKWLDILGDVHLATGDLAGAAKWYREAVAFTKKYGHRQYGRALSNLAQIAIRHGRYDEARGYLRDSIRLELEGQDPEDALRARTIQATLSLAEGKHDAAAKELQQVLAATKLPFHKLEAEEALARVYVAQKKNELAERMFARAVKTAIDERDTIAAEYRFTFFSLVDDLFDGYVDFLAANGNIDKALEVTEQARARTLAEGLGIEPSARTLAPREIAKRRNATILAYWLGKQRSYVWTITANGVAMQPLEPSAQIERELDAYRKNLEGSFDDCLARGQKLHQMLVPKVSLAKDARVIVIADGKLHSLNFETLIAPGPKPHWWIDDVVVSSAGSLQLLARPRAPRTPARSMLLVGNPTQADPKFPQLAQAGEEVRKVREHFPAKRVVLERASATPGAFLSSSPAQFEFIHFVAHGVPVRNRPLDSAVILAKEKTGDRYRLYASDVVKQKLNARLVTISSCSSAGTRAYAGEGLVGLAWAFLRAGSEQVIAALWEVPDRATPQLMDRMYAEIRKGRDPATALTISKRSFTNSSGAQRNPRYWAPFVLYSGS